MRTPAVLLIALLVVAGGHAGRAHHAQETRYKGAIAESRKVMEAIVDRFQAPGVGAAVAAGGRLVWNEGFGLADIERRVPVTEATRFGIGSISKTLTMAAAVRLMEAGRLDLDAPVERYLPDFPHAGRGITIRRLAAHQSGISDSVAAGLYSTSQHFATLDAAYQLIVKAPMEFEPGAKVAYATGLYTIIGRVLERVSGRDYATLMREEVFRVAGVPGIVPNDPRKPVGHRTVFYANRERGGFEKGPDVDPSHKLPGAGFLATAGEIATFGAALLRGPLLGDRGRAEMFRAVPLGDGSPTEWALGLRVSKDVHGRLLHLPGGGIGISAWIFLHPEADLVIALLSNVNTAPVGGRTHRQIADAFIRAGRGGSAD